MIERIQKLERMVKWLYCKVKNTAIGGIQSIVAGDNITVDNSDPANPVVSSTGGGSEQNNFNRIPSATYSELGITPESTIEEKQTAITTFLEGYDNAETDNLFFEIKEDIEPEFPINFDVASTDWVGISEADFITVLENTGISDVVINSFTNTNGRIQCNLECTFLDYEGSAVLALGYLNITEVNIINIIGLQILGLQNNLITDFNPTIPLPIGLQTLNLYSNRITDFNPAFVLPNGLVALELGNNLIADWSLSEIWANSQPNGTAFIDTEANPASSEGTNFKIILESKGWTVNS